MSSWRGTKAISQQSEEAHVWHEAARSTRAINEKVGGVGLHLFGDTPNRHVTLQLMQQTPVMSAQVLSEKIQQEKQQPKLLQEDKIKEFAQLVLQGQLAAARELIQEKIARGWLISALFTQLFPNAARIYGNGWINDDCDFTEVTTGCWRLQQLMYEYLNEFHAEGASKVSGASIWLSAAPGEQHTFGVSVLKEFLVRAGHAVEGRPVANENIVLQAVEAQYFHFVGFSISSESKVRSLAQLISSVRKHSLNPETKILVGGSLLSTMPECCDSLDADMYIDSIQDTLNAVIAIYRKTTAKGTADSLSLQ
jgi:methanogenic corrinoid protein MtbC1